MPFRSSVTGAQRGLGARDLQPTLPNPQWIAGWVGQSGVLAPWGVTVVAAPGPLGHPASICDVGVSSPYSHQ